MYGPVGGPSRFAWDSPGFSTESPHPRKHLKASWDNWSPFLRQGLDRKEWASEEHRTRRDRITAVTGLMSQGSAAET